MPDLINQSLDASIQDNGEPNTGGAAPHATSSNTPIIRILCLDGGGVRGAAIAGFLEELETALGKKYPPVKAGQEFRLCDFFDIIAGNSTGSIIASLVATRTASEQIKCNYLELAKTAFPPVYRSWKFWLASFGGTGLIGLLLLVMAHTLPDVFQYWFSKELVDANIYYALMFVIAYLLVLAVLYNKAFVTGLVALYVVPLLVHLLKLYGVLQLPDLPGWLEPVYWTLASVALVVLLFWGEKGVYPHQLWLAKNANLGLRRSLLTVLGEHTFKSVPSLTPRVELTGFKRTMDHCILMIPAVDLYSREVVVHKSPHPGSLTPQYEDTLLREAVLRSAAAPMYLPVVSSNEKKENFYADGVLWANNPAIIAVTEALKYGKTLLLPRVDLRVLSIGTGAPSSTPLKKPWFRSGSILWWAKNIITCMLDSQGRGISYCVGELLSSSGGSMYKRVDFKLPPGLGAATDDARRVTGLVEQGKLHAKLYDPKTYLPQPGLEGTGVVVAHLVTAL